VASKRNEDISNRRFIEAHHLRSVDDLMKKTGIAIQIGPQRGPSFMLKSHSLDRKFD
jgi:hypothetical protein